MPKRITKEDVKPNSPVACSYGSCANQVERNRAVVLVDNKAEPADKTKVFCTKLHVAMHSIRYMWEHGSNTKQEQQYIQIALNAMIDLSRLRGAATE